MDKKFSYRNPLVYQRADPFVCYHNGMYYFSMTALSCGVQKRSTSLRSQIRK